MPSRYRHRRTSTSGAAFPNLEPGEIVVNTANRSIAVGDAAAGTLGVPKLLLGVRYFDANAQYGAGNYVDNGGQLYRSKVAISTPAAFNASQWDAVFDARGGTLNGDIKITKADPAIRIDKTSGGSYLEGDKAGSPRWVMALGDFATESGTNTGSNFYLQRFNNDGTPLAYSLHIKRDSGYVGIGTTNSQHHLHLYNSATAVFAVECDNGASNAAQIVFKENGAQKGLVDWVTTAFPGIGNTLRVGTLQNSAISLFTNGTERIRILGDGSNFTVNSNITCSNLQVTNQINVGGAGEIAFNYAGTTNANFNFYNGGSQAASILFINGATRQIGVQLTGSLGATLEVAGTIGMRHAYARLEHRDAAGTHLWTVGMNNTQNYDISREAGGGNVRISGGYVMVGSTNSPTARLHVQHGGSPSAPWSSAFLADGSYGGGYGLKDGSGAGMIWMQGGYMVLGAGGSGGVYSTLQLTAGDNCGIGKTPGVKLDVNGEIRTNTRFYSESSEGIVLVGSNGGGAPYFNNHTKGSVAALPAGYEQHLQGVHYQGAWSGMMFALGGYSVRFEFRHDGLATKLGGGSWVDNSDARIKNVEGDYTLGLDEIIKLQPVIYTYKGNDTDAPPTWHADTASIDEIERAKEEADGREPEAPYRNSFHFRYAKDGKQMVGLLAQDVEQYFPGTVTKRKGYIDGVEVDDLRDFNNTELTYALINAVKTLDARLDLVEGAISQPRS